MSDSPVIAFLALFVIGVALTFSQQLVREYAEQQPQNAEARALADFVQACAEDAGSLASVQLTGKGSAYNMAYVTLTSERGECESSGEQVRPELPAKLVSHK